jgi:hypothetical protein
MFITNLTFDNEIQMFGMACKCYMTHRFDTCHAFFTLNRYLHSFAHTDVITLKSNNNITKVSTS